MNARARAAADASVDASAAVVMPSVLDFFTIGIGPSSSHTVGPMRAAQTFACTLTEAVGVGSVHRITVELRGSLGATGRGHGTDAAVLAGLEGDAPETVDAETLGTRLEAFREHGCVHLGGRRQVPADLVFDPRQLGEHPNGMVFRAMDRHRRVLLEQISWSIGGGFVHRPAAPREPDVAVPHPFATGAELLATCADTGWSVAQVVRRNEEVRRPWLETVARLGAVEVAMAESVRRGAATRGRLPGVLGLARRAATLVEDVPGPDGDHGLEELDRLAAAAIAVSEENAAGHRVVTAPTNGASGVVPAVLDHALRTRGDRPLSEVVIGFLLTAGAIAWLCKHNASLSGAEVGCQGEVGSACAMAAAGLTAVRGGSPSQVENAAEIALEHHLGLTCDPVAGLVQVPCIERNGVGAVKAVVASRLALRGDGRHRVPLDQVLATVRSTGADMSLAYKETAMGGLAVNVTVC